VTHRGAWTEVTAAGCGEVVTHDAAAIAAGLGRLLDRPVDACRMGERGSAWIRRAFGWNEIGGAMAREYDVLAGSAERVRQAG
jgi:hypothetical protein